MMKIIWIIMAALSFLGGQVCLLLRLLKLDKFLQRKSKELTYDDRCRYPEEDVVE